MNTRKQGALAPWHADRLNTCVLAAKEKRNFSIIVQLIKWKKRPSLKKKKKKKALYLGSINRPD